MRNSKLVATKVGIATSMLGIVVALSGITSGFAAGGDAPTAGDSSAGSASTSASVVVPPWCGWNINPVVSSITLTPSGNYLGADLTLTGSTSDVNAYVGATTGATVAPASDNCSWFGKTPLNASFGVTIATDDAKFSAASGSNPDAGMGWDLSVKPLVITNSFTDGCTAAGFTPNSGASMSAAGSTNAWSVSGEGVVTTNNFCNYSVSYTATIPAGKEPVYGDSTYVFTGPSLIHTLTTN